MKSLLHDIMISPLVHTTLEYLHPILVSHRTRDSGYVYKRPWILFPYFLPSGFFILTSGEREAIVLDSTGNEVAMPHGRFIIPQDAFSQSVFLGMRVIKWQQRMIRALKRLDPERPWDIRK